MIENILKPNILSTIIILNNPNMSYIFLDKYVHKINWLEIFKNLENYKGIISLMRKNFKLEYFKNGYLIFVVDRNIKVFRMLIEKVADKHVLNEHVLRAAGINGNLEVVKLLLQKGVDVHSGNDNLLRAACDNGNLEVIKFLLEKGANLHAANNSALKYASYNGHSKVVKILLENESYVQNVISLSLASNNGHLEVIKILFEKGANIHGQIYGSIRCACQYGHIKVIRLLLEKGNDPHAYYDNFALRLAHEKGYSKIVKILKAEYLTKGLKIEY